MAKYNIGGYIFTEENSAKKAAKELKTVEYILGQIKTADEESVLKVYKKLINQRLFSTEIGIGFLKQLRQNLVASGIFSESDIPEVYSLDEEASASAEPLATEQEPLTEAAESSLTSGEASTLDIKKSTKAKKEKADKKNRAPKSNTSVEFKRLKIINGVLTVAVITLALSVVGMFYVNSTINSPTILNYKEAITDEYSSWKQELDQREKELNEREAQLEARENQ